MKRQPKITGELKYDNKYVRNNWKAKNKGLKHENRIILRLRGYKLCLSNECVLERRSHFFYFPVFLKSVETSLSKELENHPRIQNKTDFSFKSDGKIF